MNYVLLSVIFIPSWLFKVNNANEIRIRIRENWWKYLLVSLADVEANYLIVKAYSFTIVTTIQVYIKLYTDTCFYNKIYLQVDYRRIYLANYSDSFLFLAQTVVQIKSYYWHC